MGDSAVSGNVYITANSPGEIAGWVVPVARALKDRDPAMGITLVTTPCQYASGMETAVASSVGEIDRVISVSQLICRSLAGKERDRSRGPGSLVLYLGGDMLYAVLLSRALGLRAWAYAAKPRHSRRFERFLVPDRAAHRRFLDAGIEAHRVTEVGHLGLDSVSVTRDREAILRGLTGGSDNVVTLLPGSRPVEIRYMVPFLIQVADRMKQFDSSLHLFLAVSPFASGDLLRRAVEQAASEMDCEEIVTPGGRRIGLVREKQHDTMSVSRLAIAVPGTNNLQLAAMGVPMLVVTPLNWAEHIPVDGLLGLLNPRIPPFGLLKRRLILNRLPHTKWVSLPNTISGRMIVPEMIGILQPEAVAERADELLSSPKTLSAVRRDIAEFAHLKGASERIATLVLSSEEAAA